MLLETETASPTTEGEAAAAAPDYSGAGLREISPASWIVENRSGKYVGLLFKTGAAYKIIEGLGSRTSLNFQDRKAVQDHFGAQGRDIFKSAVKGSAVKERSVVNGYPANVDDPVQDTEESGRTGLPVFRKAAGQKSLYVAGYHLHRKEGDWKKAFCPQLATITGAAEHRGPFATETEQLGELNFLRAA